MANTTNTITMTIPIIAIRAAVSSPVKLLRPPTDEEDEDDGLAAYAA